MDCVTFEQTDETGLSPRLRIATHEIQFLCNCLRYRQESRARLILARYHGDGDSYHAIAAEFQTTYITVANAVCRFWRKVRCHQWTDEERAILEEIKKAGSVTPDAGLWEEAKAIHASLKGRCRSRPPALQYDELGRPVTSHATLITVWDIYRLLLVRRER